MLPGGVGVPELIIVGIIALLLFGKRLPEVARSLGKGIVEFKKGMAGIEDEVRNVGRSTSKSSGAASTVSRPTVEDDDQKWQAPKFDLPKSEPHEEEARA